MKTDSALALLSALDCAPHLSLAEAGRLTGLSRTALRVAAEALLDAGVLRETYEISVASHRPAAHYLHTDTATVTVLDMTTPTPRAQVLDGTLLPLGATHTVYNRDALPDENLRLLCERARCLTPMRTDISTPSSAVLIIPQADLPTPSGRSTAKEAYVSNPSKGFSDLHILTRPQAVAAAMRVHPATIDAQSVLYVSLTPTPCALFFLRTPATKTHPGEASRWDFVSIPALYPLAEGLSAEITAHPGDAGLLAVTPLLHDFLRFCHPDVLFLESSCRLPKNLLRLPDNITCVTADSHARVSTTTRGAALLARRLCDKAILARLF